MDLADPFARCRAVLRTSLQHQTFSCIILLKVTRDILPYSVRISALALLKMAMHAKSGGNIEIMGMLYGKIQGDTFIVIDAFALPVEGTETRVNAQAEAYEYMVDFAETNKVRVIHSFDSRVDQTC